MKIVMRVGIFVLVLFLLLSWTPFVNYMEYHSIKVPMLGILVFGVIWFFMDLVPFLAKKYLSKGKKVE